MRGRASPGTIVALPTSRAISRRVRAVFFGTPALAVPALRALVDVADVVGVVCQPDRGRGRGLKVEAPPVKRSAQELQLPVYQPEKVRDGRLETWLRERAPDLALVVAYGRILPPAVLAAPRVGCMNLHASILPRYRGAAPIQRAIMNGETETGVALMQMDEGLDTGAVYVTRGIAIGPEETAGQLAERIAELAAICVRDDLVRAVGGELAATPQDHPQATYAPPIGPEDTRIDWRRSAVDLMNQTRGLAPRPGAFTTLKAKRIRILEARRVDDAIDAAPGQLHLASGRMLAATGRGSLEIRVAQVEGKKPLSARELINGRAVRTGDVLGT